MGDRRRAREYALQALFQIDLAGGGPDEVFGGFWPGAAEEDPDVRQFAERLARGATARRDEFDGWIAAAAEHWKVERMAAVDRNVLRLALFELLDDDPIPAAVVIDEAVEIAKKFGGGESGAFINAILDSIRRRIEAERPSRLADR